MIQKVDVGFARAYYAVQKQIAPMIGAICPLFQGEGNITKRNHHFCAGDQRKNPVLIL
jgi:hypothetical protein